MSYPFYTWPYRIIKMLIVGVKSFACDWFTEKICRTCRYWDNKNGHPSRGFCDWIDYITTTKEGTDSCSHWGKRK